MNKYAKYLRNRAIQIGFQNSVLLNVFVVYSLFTQFSLSEVVICLGEDGHLAIESPQAKLHCAIAEEGEQRQESIIFTPTNLFHKNDCRDILMFNNL